MASKPIEMKPLNAVSGEGLFGDLLGNNPVAADSVSEVEETWQAQESEITDSENHTETVPKARPSRKRKGRRSGADKFDGTFVHCTIDMPVEFHKRMRRYAFEHNDSIHNLVMEAVDMYLKKMKI